MKLSSSMKKLQVFLLLLNVISTYGFTSCQNKVGTEFSVKSTDYFDSSINPHRGTLFVSSSRIKTSKCQPLKSIKIDPDDSALNDDTSKGFLPKTITVDQVEISTKETALPLSLLYFSQLILFIGVGAVIPTLPLYAKEIGLSASANGLVISCPAVALLLLSRISGEYADKARKPAMIFGMAIIALSDLGTALSTSLAPLLLARFGLGAGRCISESGERGLLADFASTVPELRGRILALQQATIALGIAIGSPIGGYIVEEYGPRAAFLCVTLAATLNFIIYFFLPETVKDLGDITNANNNNSNNNKEEAKEEDIVKWGELLKDPKWRGLSFFEAGAKWGYAAKLASIPILAANTLPGGAVGAGALLSAAGLSGLAGAPLGGILVDKVGAKNTMVATGVTGGVGLISIPFSLIVNAQQQPDDILLGGFLPTWSLLCISVLVWSTSVAAMNPSITALAQEISPEGSEATAMALPRAAGDSMYLIAPLLLGAVADLNNVPVGTECAVAGVLGLVGVAALIALE